MSHDLVEVATYAASVVVPDPGEKVTAASVIVACQPLANRCKALKEGNVAIAGNKAYSGTQTFNNGVSFNGAVSCSDAVGFGGGGASVTMAAPLTMSGATGTTAYRVDTTSITNTSSPQTITVEADLYVIPSGHSNDLDIRLSTTGAADGMKVRLTRIHASSGGRDVAMRTTTPTTLITFENGSTASWAEFVFYSGDWHISAFFSDSYTVA